METNRFVNRILLTVPALLLIIALLPLAFLKGATAYVTAAVTPMNKTVIIDAGHGGEDAGAIGKNGVYEKDLNLTLAKLLAEKLRESGFVVVMTREDDRLLYRESENIKGMRKISDLKNRVAIANSYENALFISIHMNSFSDGRYSGFTTYFGKSEGSAALGQSIQDSVVKELQPDNKRPLKSGDSLYLLENSTNPTVLLECGFLSNAEECERLCEKEYQKQLCFSIIYGIIDYVEK